MKVNHEHAHLIESHFAVGVQHVNNGSEEVVTNLYLGILPPWSFAVVVCVVASAASVIGFILQKMVLRDQDELKKWPRVFDITLSPKWFLGFLLVTLVPIPAKMFVYSLGPLSLVTPLAGLAVALNMVLAPLVLGERLQLFIDIPATVCIILGMLLTTAFGAHEDFYGIIDGQVLLMLLESRLFLSLALIIGVTFAVCVACMLVFARELEDAAVARPENPPVSHVLLPALASAAAGCFTAIGLKGFVELAQAKAAWSHLAICVFVGVVPPALVQLNFVNRGLRLYPQMIFLPVYKAALVLLSTACASVFFHEYAPVLARDGSGASMVMFCLGVLLVSSGIGAFGLRHPQQAPRAQRKPAKPFLSPVPEDRAVRVPSQF